MMAILQLQIPSNAVAVSVLFIAIAHTRVTFSSASPVRAVGRGGGRGGELHHAVLHSNG